MTPDLQQYRSPMLEREQGKFFIRENPMLIATFVQMRRRYPFNEFSTARDVGQPNKRPAVIR